MNNNEKAKQNAIRKAYGAFWDKLIPEIQNYALQNNGWITFSSAVLGFNNKEALEEIGCVLMDAFNGKLHSVTEMVEDSVEMVEGVEIPSWHNKYRLASLKGIEDNNGWIHVRTIEDLPKQGCYCRIYVRTQKKQRVAWYYSKTGRFRETGGLNYLSWEIRSYKVIPDDPGPVY